MEGKGSRSEDPVVQLIHNFSTAPVDNSKVPKISAIFRCQKGESRANDAQIFLRGHHTRQNFLPAPVRHGFKA